MKLLSNIIRKWVNNNMICYILISSISGYTIILDDKIVCTKRHIFLVSCQFEMDTYLIGDKSVMQLDAQ